MLLSELFEPQFASATLLGAGGKISNFGEIFASNPYVAFYFHHENAIVQLPNPDSIEVGRISQQLKPCQLFLEQAKILVENLRGGSNGGGSNAKKAKSASGQGDDCLAVIFVSITKSNEGDGSKTDCIIGQGLRDDFIWILPGKEQQAKVIFSYGFYD